MGPFINVDNIITRPRTYIRILYSKKKKQKQQFSKYVSKYLRVQ